MDSETAIEVRNKILGTMLRLTRVRAGLLPEECALALGCDVARIETYEMGRVGIPLSGLEPWSRATGVPISQFLQESPVLPDPQVRPADPLVLGLRSKMIGVTLRQARLSKGLSVEDGAAAAGVPLADLVAGEEGVRELPFVRLERLAELYGVPVTAFVDEALLAPAAPEVAEPSPLAALPQDIRDFVFRPENARFVRFAQRLSVLSPDVLLQLGQGLIDSSANP